jgi:cell division protein FtsA
MVPRSRLAEILQGRAEELFQLLFEEIRSVGLEKTINAGLVLTGGGASLQGLPEVAEGIFDHQVRVGEPMGVQGLTNIVSSPIFATSVGLAIYGAKAEAQDGNGKKKGGLFRRIFSSLKDTF